MRLISSATHLLVVGVLLTGALTPVWAVDGVIEINQAAAKAGAVTPGDTALFPVTISQPGSYRLTSNLDVTDATARANGVDAEDASAIEVTADNVSIDLNGFTIKGATVCTGSPVTSCSPTGEGAGIAAGFRSGMSVVNGTVQGMGAAGVALGALSRVERVTAISNALTGVSVGTNSRVTNVTASGNGTDGIKADAYAFVSGNTSVSNMNAGISGNAFSVISGNVTTRNGTTGVSAGIRVTAIGNTSAQNLQNGIELGSGCTVADNSAGDNGADGIRVTTGTTVIRNTVRENTGYGLRFSDGSTGYANNVISSNTAGTVTGGGTQIPAGSNLCNGSTTCP